MDLKQLAILAALVEAVVTLLMSVYVADSTKPFMARLNYKLIVSIIIGELLAFGFGADFLTQLGIPSAIPPIGVALTGLLLGRGSNFVHDLIVLTQSAKETQQAKALLAK
jgi:hypothetical protein